jgi:hypothetical protein
MDHGGVQTTLHKVIQTCGGTSYLFQFHLLFRNKLRVRHNKQQID